MFLPCFGVSKCDEVMGDLAWVKDLPSRLVTVLTNLRVKLCCSKHSTWEDCVKKGANVNCRLDEKGFTPLMLASEGAPGGMGLFYSLRIETASCGR